MQSPECHSSLFICVSDMLWRSGTHSSVSRLTRNVTEDRRCRSGQSVCVHILWVPAEVCVTRRGNKTVHTPTENGVFVRSTSASPSGPYRLRPIWHLCDVLMIFKWELVQCVCAQWRHCIVLVYYF